MWRFDQSEIEVHVCMSLLSAYHECELVDVGVKAFEMFTSHLMCQEIVEHVMKFASYC